MVLGMPFHLDFHYAGKPAYILMCLCTGHPLSDSLLCLSNCCHRGVIAVLREERLMRVLMKLLHVTVSAGYWRYFCLSFGGWVSWSPMQCSMPIDNKSWHYGACKLCDLYSNLDLLLQKQFQKWKPCKFTPCINYDYVRHLNTTL